MADLACAIADGARVISDFRVMTDQQKLFGPVASVPTAWRTLAEIARREPGGQADHGGGDCVTAARVGAGGGPARRAARGAAGGPDPGRGDLHPARCHRYLRALKELAEANFKGYGLLTELPEASSHFRERVA
jgi:hypothetical protein